MSRTKDEVARERERCAQACENMIVGQHIWDPDRQLTPAEALTEAARRIRAGEFGAIDWTGWRSPLLDRLPLQVVRPLGASLPKTDLDELKRLVDEGVVTRTNDKKRNSVWFELAEDKS